MNETASILVDDHSCFMLYFIARFFFGPFEHIWLLWTHFDINSWRLCIHILRVYVLCVYVYQHVMECYRWQLSATVEQLFWVESKRMRSGVQDFVFVHILFFLFAELYTSKLLLFFVVKIKIEEISRNAIEYISNYDILSLDVDIRFDSIHKIYHDVSSIFISTNRTTA